MGTPLSFEEPYRVIGIEPCTPTIVELWLRPIARPLQYLPGEYVVWRTATARSRRGRTRSRTRPVRVG